MRSIYDLQRLISIKMKVVYRRYQIVSNIISSWEKKGKWRKRFMKLEISFRARNIENDNFEYSQNKWKKKNQYR